MHITFYSTYGVKYLGSKREILPYIWNAVADLNIKSAIDVFTGTTRVAQYLRQRDVRMATSDLSWASSCYAHTYVHNQDNWHLREMIAAMNALAPVHGWLSTNYTGTVAQDAEHGDGRCFQLKNAQKADAARDWIEQQQLEPWEQATLITAVINGLDDVDNTVGVQQAYLKTWCKRSHNDIVFKLPHCLAGPIGTHIEGDCLGADYAEHDLAYLDPPYSPHSYATYYHIWDSIARWDKPETALKARRRVDRVAKHAAYDAGMQSAWNHPRSAMQAFETLMAALPVKYLLISYNDESLVSYDELHEMCGKFGRITTHEIPYSRNIMSQIGNAVKTDVNVEKNQTNRELLVLIERP